MTDRPKVGAPSSCMVLRATGGEGFSAVSSVSVLRSNNPEEVHRYQNVVHHANVGPFSAMGTTTAHLFQWNAADVQKKILNMLNRKYAFVLDPR